MIVFDDSFKGDDIRRLVEFGESLGIPVKYICLVDYSNSRGALDMGLVPGEGGMRLDRNAGRRPGRPVGSGRQSHEEAASARRRPVSWWCRTCSSPKPPSQADVVLPAACAYEKNGTVTNTTGEVQRLKRAINTMGAKPDLEIMGFIAREMGVAAALGPWVPETVFAEIRQHRARVRYSAAGDRHRRRRANDARQRPHPVETRRSGHHSDHNGLFASGTLGRYSKVLNSVLEGRLDR